MWSTNLRKTVAVTEIKLGEIKFRKLDLSTRIMAFITYGDGDTSLHFFYYIHIYVFILTLSFLNFKLLPFIISCFCPYSKEAHHISGK